MAEGVLFSNAEEIIKKLGTLAAEDVALWWGLKDQLRKLTDTVTKIKAMVPDAEPRKQNHEIEEWLKKLQEAVFDVEDVLDNFSTQVLRKQLMSGNGVSREVCAFFSRSNKFVYGLRMGHKVKALRERLHGFETESRGFNFDVRDEERASLTTVREQTTSPEPEVLVGRESDIAAVKRFLLDSNDLSYYSRAISIVGTAGLGKTTLAQHVFNDEQVDRHFGVKRWVSVSGGLDVRKILKGVVESDSDQLEILKNEIKNKFGRKFFLLVLDDVRDGEDGLNAKKWNSLMELLVCKKIVVTTRSHAIAKLTIAPHVLEGLSVDESWDLFRRMAFCQGQESEHVDEKIREEIVGRCRGVPLVIKAIARLLSLKDRAQWLSFILNELPYRIRDYNIIQTLELSYGALPSYMKHCFAYCSLFPKNHEVDVRSLIQLWIAQGFISSSNSGDRCLETAGLRCFEDLFRRSFFREVKRDDLGNIISCKMNSRMYDVAAKVGAFESTKVDGGRNRISDSTRHVSLDEDLNFPPHIQIPLPRAKRLRTLILQSVKWDEGTWESICRDFRRLRVLVLPNLTIRKVSPLIEKLKHLRYLDLSNNHMEALPYSITNLINLQVLKLNRCKNLKKLPRDINKLINLRHLDLGLCRSLEYMPLGIGKLTYLQTLSYFVVAKNSSHMSKNIGGLDEFSGLNELTIEWEWDDGSDSDTYLYDKMLLSLQPNSNLQELRLIEHGGVSFLSSLSHLSNLVRIRLEKCRRLEHIPPLDGILSLEVLLIEDMERLEYIDSEGVGGKGVSMFFPSLKKLVIKSCGRLKGWWKKSKDEMNDDSDESTIEEELIMLYFPRLSSLSIYKCPNLTSMPLFPTLNESLYLKETSSMPLQQTMKMKSPVSSSSSSSFMHPLSKLKNLDIDSVGDMESLPEVGLQNLSSLQQLSIRGCGRLNSLPLPDQGMHSLQKLDISNCPELRLLDYRGVRFPSWFSNVVRIRLEMCRRLEHIPPLDGILSLEVLLIEDMERLEYIDSEGVGGKGVSMFFPSLKKLMIKSCGRLKGWWKKSRDEMNDDSDESTIEEELIMLSFPRLSSLSIYKCPNLTSMPLFPTLDESLYLKETSSMPLQQTMKMKSPVSSSSSSFIHPLSKLKNLDIGSVGDMESLPKVGLQNLSSLQRLSINGCERLKSLPLPDQGMHSLQKLDISNCRELKCLSQSESQGMIPYLPSLRELRIIDCSKELSRRIIIRGGKEWPHIKHIPSIVIDGYGIQQ
ncbi:putative disease resistance protein RGA3 [Populus nigra]|uniref:putative disease resistance protein RGA3 n=1 Tax=Populus nigra TaxID=3691 RepID=UPI002B26D259|nr:putative disease resistance protein RGA3 [Populus nigra]